MRLYLAGSDAAGDHLNLSGLENLRLLVSYWYVLNGKGQDVIDWANKNNVDVFLDSGAFSALMLGAKININEYIDYCLKNKSCFSVIASLDVIGDWKGTRNNHQIMKDAGVDSITAFHVNEPFDALIDMLHTENYIALGVAGMQKRSAQIMSWITKCYKLKSEINNDCKFHGFGLTSPKVMYSFDWYSVDSSTWFNARRFGQTVLRDGIKFRKFGKSDKLMMKKYGNKVANILPPRTAKTEDYNKLLRFNAQQMLEWASVYK